MVKTGILKIDNNTRISRLESGSNDKKRLAKDGEGDPFGNATDFLVDERDLDDGNFIFVVGTEGSASGVTAIFITDAGLSSEATSVLTLRATTEAGAKKKAGTKKTARKRSGRKSK